MMHEKWMRRALKEAALSGDDVPVGAVVVLNGLVIASAHNERESASASLAHAEMLALQRAGFALDSRRLTGCTLYVTLEPCPMCAGAVIMAGLGLCVFGAYDAQYGCCGSVYFLPADKHFNHTVPCIGGVLKTECEDMLETFFNTRRNQPKAKR